MRVILFDIDGTLIDAGSAASRAFERAFQEMFALDCSAVPVETAGRTDLAIQHDVSSAMLGRGLEHSESVALNSRYVRYLPEELLVETRYRVLPGVRALIKTLACREDVLMGLQTGNLEQAGKLKLAHGELMTFFSFGGFGCATMNREEVVAAALRQASLKIGEDLNTSDVFVIGDTPHDIRAGKMHGCQTLAVATGKFSASQLAESFPDVVLEDFNDVEGVCSILL